MLKAAFVFALVLAFAACEGAIGPAGPMGPQGPQGPQGPPAQPVVESAANIRIVTGRFDALVGGGERIIVTFENTGGTGTFRMQAWGLPTTAPVCPCPVDPYTRLYGETESVEVPGSWRETGSYVFDTGSTSRRIRKLTIMTRNKGSIQWRETHSLVLP